MSSRFTPAAVRFYYRAPDGIVARWNNIVIQYRNGALVAEVIDAVVKAGEEFEAGSKVAAFAVLDGKAVIPSSELRTKQRGVVRELLEHLDAKMAVVVRGDDVWTQLLKSFARLVAVGEPRVMMAKSIGEAIQWLTPVGATTVDDLRAFWGFIESCASETNRGVSR